MDTDTFMEHALAPRLHEHKLSLSGRQIKTTTSKKSDMFKIHPENSKKTKVFASQAAADVQLHDMGRAVPAQIHVGGDGKYFVELGGKWYWVRLEHDGVWRPVGD